MTRVYVSIGSNIERETYIALGLNSLEQVFGSLTVSSYYESEPVGFNGDVFYNLVVGFETDLDVDTVAKKLREIEVTHGRTPDSKKFSSRKLDLDLILYGDLIRDDGSIQLPRSDIERYAFVLEPLAEIAPTLEHPILNITYADLWEQMPKDSILQRRIYSPNFNNTLPA
jgi:2-amino-4-hydroxy-6-hydroxymethyldihydropteridine diphosphokinase